MNSLRFGSHISISHGYLKAAQHALHIGAKSFQYFPKNPRNLSVKKFNKEDASACASYCREHDLLSIAHTPYPTNLSVASEELLELTIESICNDLEIAESCGSLGVVIHFGKYKGEDALIGYQLMLSMLNHILAEWEGNALILLENNAGQGSKMGTTLEELTKIRSLTNFPRKIGFCLDTCHAFASGIWTGENLDEFIQKAEELDYFSHLKAVHLNDSRYPSLSYRDRHANIGTGAIGKDPFIQLLQLDVFQNIPLVLETPHSEVYTHQEEIKFLQQLLM